MYTSQRVARNTKLPMSSSTNSRSRTTTQQLPKTQIPYTTNTRTRISTEPWTTQDLQQGHGELREFFKQARTRKLSLQNQLEQEYSQLMKQKHGDSWTLDSHKSLSTTSTRTRQVLPSLEEGTDTTSNQSYSSTLKDYAIHKTSSLFINFEEPISKSAILDNSKAEIHTQQKQRMQTGNDVRISGIAIPVSVMKFDKDLVERPATLKIILPNEVAPLIVKHSKSNIINVQLSPIPVKKAQSKESEPKGFLERLVHRKSKQQVDTSKPLPPPEINEVLQIISKSRSMADQQLLSKLHQLDKDPIDKVPGQQLNLKMEEHKSSPVNNNPTCSSCKRHFTADRLEYHEKICTSKAKVREPFDVKKQRTGKFIRATNKVNDKPVKTAFNPNKF